MSTHILINKKTSQFKIEILVTIEMIKMLFPSIGALPKFASPYSTTHANRAWREHANWDGT